MKTKEKIRVEHAEFTLTNGSHIVFRKQRQGWMVTKYVHGELGRQMSTVGHLPTVVNAIYFDSKM